MHDPLQRLPPGTSDRPANGRRPQTRFFGTNNCRHASAASCTCRAPSSTAIAAWPGSRLSNPSSASLKMLAADRWIEQTWLSCRTTLPPW